MICADMIFVNEWNNCFGVLLREMEKPICKTYTGPKTEARGSRAKKGDRDRSAQQLHNPPLDGIAAGWQKSAQYHLGKDAYKQE